MKASRIAVLLKPSAARVGAAGGGEARRHIPRRRHLLPERTAREKFTGRTGAGQIAAADRKMGHMLSVVSQSLCGAREVRYMSGMLDLDTIKLFSTEIAKANFGAENVVRVESEPTVDSQGEEALDVLVVLAPGVAENFTGAEVVDTLVQISAKLMEAEDERLPIIRYATEEERCLSICKRSATLPITIR
jgi:hypothetical protein